MRSIQPCLASVVAATTVALGAACGGGGGDGDRLTREELIQQGDAICSEFESRVDEIDEPEGPDDVERYIGEARPIVEEGADALDELQPPEELEDDYDEWIRLSREGVAAFDDLEAAAADGDEQRIQEITQDLQDEEAEADRIAQSIGFEQCGDES
jgi:hypothetical protein